MNKKVFKKPKEA